MMKASAIILASAMFFASCSNNKSDETTTVTDDASTTAAADTSAMVATTPAPGASVEVTTEEVPENVRTTFTTKYPKAEKITWSKYQPSAEDEGWKMDQTYYYVRYNNDGVDYWDWYSQSGDWAKTSTKIAHKDLPAAVNKYITDNYSGYTVVEVDKENDKDREMYEVELNKGDDKVKLKLLPNGEVFKKK